MTYHIIQGKNAKIRILIGSGQLDVDNDNVDIEIQTLDGKWYYATFYTLQNIATLMERYKISGECNYGQYFRGEDMVIVKDLKFYTITEVAESLVETGETRYLLQDDLPDVDKPEEKK